MDLKPLFVLALPVLLFVAVGLVGSTRRLGFWWTVALSVALTPIGGLLVAVLTGARQPRTHGVTAGDRDRP
jgi:hypothetical protein